MTTIEQLRRHEAAHSIIGSLLDFDVDEVRAAPDGGVVTFNHREEWTAGRLAEMFVVVASGPMSEKSWPPWPPSAHVEGSDEQNLARLVGLLGLDERQYDALIQVAADLVAHPAVRAASAMVADLLPHTTSLTGRQVSDVLEVTAKQVFAEAEREEVATDPEFEAVRDATRRMTAHALQRGDAQSLRARALKVANECGVT